MPNMPLAFEKNSQKVGTFKKFTNIAFYHHWLVARPYCPTNEWLQEFVFATVA
jgi:hypothetical protein